MALIALTGLGGLLLLAAALGPAIARDAGYAAFVALLLAGGCAALLARNLAEQTPARAALFIIFGVAIVMRLVVMLQDPFLSTDIYRYVWDGRVQGASINPYRFVPADPALAFLRDTAIFSNINRAGYAVTAYPPVAQMFFFAVTRISECLFALRLAMIACEAGLVVALLAILRRLGRPATDIVVWGWHPLAIWEIAHSGHVEALMAALSILGLFLLLRGRRVAGAIAVTLAALAKPYALVTLPMFWRRWEWRVPAAVLATIALCYVPYLGVGRGVLGFLASGYLAEEGFAAGQGFWIVALLQSVLGPVPGIGTVYIIASLGILGTLALRIVSDPAPDARTTVDRFGLMLLAGLFLLSPNYPWYFLSLVPLIALCRPLVSIPAAALTIAAVLLYRPLILPHHDLAWKTLATLPFLIALACAMAAKHETREPSGVPQWTN
jgi:hypothetical protein